MKVVCTTVIPTQNVSTLTEASLVRVKTGSKVMDSIANNSRKGPFRVNGRFQVAKQAFVFSVQLEQFKLLRLIMAGLYKTRACNSSKYRIIFLT